VIQHNKKLTPEEALSRFKRPNISLLDHGESEVSNKPARYGFVIEKIGFLIALNTLSEIVINTKIYPIPNTQEWMKGLINVRGNLVPVFDFSLLLGFSVKPQEQKKLLVLGKESQAIGLLIDGLPQACDTSQWRKVSCLPNQVSVLEKYIANAYSSDDAIWIDFNQDDYFKSIRDEVVI